MTVEQQVHCYSPIEEAKEEYRLLTSLTIDKTRSIPVTRQVTPENKSKVVQILHISPTMSGDDLGEHVPVPEVIAIAGEVVNFDSNEHTLVDYEEVARVPVEKVEVKNDATIEEDDDCMYIRFEDKSAPTLCISMPEGSDTINGWHSNDADMSCELFSKDSTVSSFIERIKEMAKQDILAYSFEAQCQSFSYSISVVAGSNRSISVMKFGREEELQVYQGDVKLGTFLQACKLF